MAIAKKAKTKNKNKNKNKTTKTEKPNENKTKEMKLNWSLGENWTHDHNSRTPPQKDCFWDCENAITNSVMINYSWQENEKFAREMLHLFTCKAKNKIHFVADFITVYTKSVGFQISLWHSLSFILFSLHSQTSLLGFEKEQLSIVPTRIFSWSTAKYTSGHPFPHQKKNNNKQINKQTERKNAKIWARIRYWMWKFIGLEKTYLFSGGEVGPKLQLRNF